MNKMNKFFCGAAMTLLTVPGLVADAFAAPAPDLNSSSGVIALNSLPNPPITLATASVVDAKGTVVGAVEKVVMDGAGKPLAVDVTLLGSNAVVALDASKFNYDQAHNVLTAELDAQQIAQAPRAPLS